MEYSIKYIKPITTKNNSVLEFELTAKFKQHHSSNPIETFTLHVSPYTKRVVGNYEFFSLMDFIEHCKEEPKIYKSLNKSYEEVSEALSIIENAKKENK